jgi:hypothetical protein
MTTQTRAGATGTPIKVKQIATQVNLKSPPRDLKSGGYGGQWRGVRGLFLLTFRTLTTLTALTSLTTTSPRVTTHETFK